VCRPRKSLSRIVPPAARWAAIAALSRRHRRTSWPARAKSPAAANDPLPPPSTAMRMRSALAVQVEIALQEGEVLQQLRLRDRAELTQDRHHPLLVPARH